MKEWISKLKAGSPVIVNYVGRTVLTSVENITPSGLIRVRGVLYNKDGTSRGDTSWGGGRYITEATKEAVDELRKKVIVRRVYEKIKQIDPNLLGFEKAVDLAELFDWFTDEDKAILDKIYFGDLPENESE